jgi:hypothetical protein
LTDWIIGTVSAIHAVSGAITTNTVDAASVFEPVLIITECFIQAFNIAEDSIDIALLWQRFFLLLFRWVRNSRLQGKHIQACAFTTKGLVRIKGIGSWWFGYWTLRWCHFIFLLEKTGTAFILVIILLHNEAWTRKHLYSRTLIV